MIVEFCGPPCVGKTTLANALCERLQERGAAVALASSYRPSERGNQGGSAPLGGRFADPLRRLIRPMAEVLSATSGLESASREAMVARRLVALMPPDSILWSIRLRQYAWRLSHLWAKAGEDNGIVIFDQAFVQLVCSLVLLSAAANESRITEALDLVPRPDLLVRMHAPRALLQTRLMKRERRQGRIDRMLEFDLATNLRSIDVLGAVSGLMERHSVRCVAIGCTDPDERDSRLRTLEHAVLGGVVAEAAAA